MINIEFKPFHKGIKLPEYATNGSSGFDLVANNFKKLFQASNYTPIDIGTATESCTLRPGDRLLVGCGFSMAIPEGFEMQVRPRSGLALKQGISVLNSPGTIDSDYRGEIGVILINHSKDAVVINLGNKIAQGVIQQVFVAKFRLVDELSETLRGEGGFGSTTNQNY